MANNDDAIGSMSPPTTFADTVKRFQQSIDTGSLINTRAPPNFARDVFASPARTNAEWMDTFAKHTAAMTKVTEWFRCHTGLDPLSGAEGEMLDKIFRAGLVTVYKDFKQ